MYICIARVTWSLAGNCILLAHKRHSATDLEPYANSLSHLLTECPIQVKAISEDKPWPQVVINGVDTGISPWDDNPSPHPMTHILNTLHTDNPWFTSIKIKEEPRWLCGPESIGSKKHSSIVLTLDDLDSLKELLERRTIFGWGHPMHIKEYLNMKPNRQCLKCWSLTHNTSACILQYRCRHCSGYQSFGTNKIN
jgi:hypothetical protein